jgi:uncharacterized protein
MDAQAHTMTETPAETLQETPAPSPPAPTKRRRGFAAMSPEKVRAIAHLGGLAAHRKGTAHKFSPEEARAAGRKGGIASHQRPRRTDEETPETDPSARPSSP